tara:strand:- start:998 stop:1156 length:159 start_codon:yes stop_codon:yes gene_type:complete
MSEPDDITKALKLQQRLLTLMIKDSRKSLRFNLQQKLEEIMALSEMVSRKFE